MFRRKTKHYYFGTALVNVLKNHHDGYVTVELADGTRKIARTEELSYR